MHVSCLCGNGVSVFIKVRNGKSGSKNLKSIQRNVVYTKYQYFKCLETDLNILFLLAIDIKMLVPSGFYR